MEKVVEKATANNYFSVSSDEYISNYITSISFLAVVQKVLNEETKKKREGKEGGRGEVKTNNGKKNYFSLYK